MSSGRYVEVQAVIRGRVPLDPDDYGPGYIIPDRASFRGTDEDYVNVLRRFALSMEMHRETFVRRITVDDVSITHVDGQDVES